MSQIRRILCVIDPDARGEQVLRLASTHAQRTGAELMTAHVVDYHTGFESSHAPFLSPTQLNAELAGAAFQRIRVMLDKIRAGGKLRVEVGPPRETVIDMATEFAADLVIVGVHSPFGLRTTQANTVPDRFPFEVLTVHVKRSWNFMHWLHHEGKPEPRHLPPAA
jgi:nucleotide-binding universal stress UspA family protein